MIERVPLPQRLRHDAEQALLSGTVVYARTVREVQKIRSGHSTELVDYLADRYQMPHSQVRHALFVAHFTTGDAYHWLKRQGRKIVPFPVMHRSSGRRKRRKLMGTLARQAFGKHAH